MGYRRNPKDTRTRAVLRYGALLGCLGLSAESLPLGPELPPGPTAVIREGPTLSPRVAAPGVGKLPDQAWGKVDVALESAFWTSFVVDWAQTRYIAKNGYRYTRIWAHHEVVDGVDTIVPTRDGDWEFMTERNPILGKHPSLRRVDAYFILSGVAHVAIARSLPERWRRVFLVSAVTLEAYCVGNNIRLGVRLR